MAIISKPSIPEIVFERIKSDLVEFAFNFFQDGVALDVSSRSYKLRFKTSGVQVLEKVTDTNTDGRITFILSNAEKSVLNTADNQISLVEILSSNAERTLMAGSVVWNVTAGKATGMALAPDVTVNYISATQELMVALGVLDLGSMSSAASAALASQQAELAGAIAADVFEARNETLLTKDEVAGLSQQVVTNKGAVEVIAQQVGQDKILVENAKETVLNAISGIPVAVGTYDASTGLARRTEDGTTFTPTAVASLPNGHYLTVVVAGTQSIAIPPTGTTPQSIPMEVGSTIRSTGTKYEYIPNNSLADEKTEVLENKVGKIQTLGFYTLPVTSASGNVLNKVCLNQRQIAQMGGSITKVRAKTTTSGNAYLLVLRKNATGTSYVEASRTLINFPTAGDNVIDVSGLNLKMQRGDTCAIQYSAAGVEFKTNTTASSGRGLFVSIIGGTVGIPVASVEGNIGNDTALVFDVILDGNLTQQVDDEVSKLNTKITDNKSSTDAAIQTLNLQMNKITNRSSSFVTNGFYQANGTFNSSTSFGNSTVPITAGKAITYNLNSTNAGVGVRILTFFDAANNPISFISATAAQYHSGTVSAPAGSAKVVLCNLRAGGENAYYETLDDISPAIQAINTSLATKQVKESSLSVLKVSKTLVADNITVFSTVAAALAAWTPNNIIYIYDGVYDEKSLAFPDGVNIKGIGIVELRGSNPNTAITADVDAQSTVDWPNSGKIENLIITARNMRYPVHSDFGNPNATQYVINCRIIHYGNNDIYAYRLANGSSSPNAAADVWRATSAWGCGTQAGSKIYLKNTYLESPGRALSTHNNANYNLTGGASLLQADDCEFVSHGIDRDGSLMAFAPTIFVQSLGSKTFDKVIINNTKVNGHLVLQSSTADWREFTQDVIGSGISGHLMQVRNVAGGSKLMTDETTKQTAFVIRVKSASTNPITVSGNLVATMFGNYTALNGSTGINSYIKGRVYHGDVWQGVNAFAQAKTISFTSGADSKLLTLSATYTSASQLINDMNAQFGAGSFVAELYWPGFDWYPKFANEIENLRNTGTTAILRGRAVKSNGFRKIAPMTSADPASAFLGIAVQDIPVNSSGDVKVKGYMLRIWADGLFNTGLADNDLIKVNNDGTFSKSADGTGVIVSKCVATENIGINMP